MRRESIAVKVDAKTHRLLKFIQAVTSEDLGEIIANAVAREARERHPELFEMAERLDQQQRS